MSNAPLIRTGFIGAGWADRVQIPIFRQAGLAVQAIAAAHPEKAQAVAARHQIPEVHADWRTLVESPSVDLVSICAPPALHLEMVEAALRAGKHVICEKPAALDTAQAEALLAAAQAAPNQLAIIDHELRFHPARLQMRQMIKDGFVGSVLHVELNRLGGERLDGGQPWNWWCDAEQGGGMLNAVGSHLIDQARWLVGRIESLTAQLQTGVLYRVDPQTGRERSVTSDDHAHLLLRFANGAQGAITVSGLTPGGYGMQMLVVGTRGALKLDNQDHLFGLSGERYPSAEWEPIRPRNHFPLPPDFAGKGSFAVGTFYLAQTLAMSLPMGETLLTDAASFYDGLVVQRALDAARRASATGVWATL